MTWPDLVISAIALLFALKGWKRGFVAEIGGFIALAAAIWAALDYPGTFDSTIATTSTSAKARAHVIGMVVFALIVYVALMVISAVLSRIARLPVIGIGNGAGGAVVGVVKALLGMWAVDLRRAVLPAHPRPARRPARLAAGRVRHPRQPPDRRASCESDDAVVRAAAGPPLFARHHV